MVMDTNSQLSALDQHVAPGLRLWMLIALVSGVLLIMADERAQAIVMNSMRPKGSVHRSVSENREKEAMHKGSKTQTEV
ncbi:unnamed protein product [Auanema sp. JU1783]|nr:unnamed protein product [Auanema sp. JU1783]